MALIAVLWIVAAMAILVAGMGQSVRQQIRVVASARDAVVAQAQADAAIQLTLQALQTAPQPPTAMQAHGVEFGGVPVQVIIQPLNGFIDIDRAPAPLLAALLEVAGGLPAGQAETLAQTLVDWRGSRPDGAGGPYHFEAVEDLLLVPGIDYGLYARLAPLVSADLGSLARVNPEAAPPGVLAVLAQGQGGAAQQYLRQRAGGQPGADTSGFNQAFIGTAGTSLYRLTAGVPLEAGKMLHLVQDVALVAGASRGAPWRVLRSRRQIVLTPG